jgi:hypothetical protein
VRRDEPIDGRPASPERLRRARHVAARRAQLLDQPLALAQRVAGPHRIDALGALGDHVQDQRAADHGLRREHDRATDHVLELAQVPRPVAVREELHGARREADALAADRSADPHTQI